MKDNNIKKNYQSQHTLAETKSGRDYLNGRLFETLTNFFTHILNRPFKGKLLDLGCGDGSFVEYCKTQGLSATGLDIDSGVNFEHNRLPYPDNHFDIVHFYAVIEHINDVSNILGEIKRVLRAGGIVIIVTPNFDYTVKTFYDDPTHIKPYNPRSLSYLMRIFKFKEEFVGLWTVKKSSLIWKLPLKLQFLIGRVLPFSGKNRYAPKILTGKSTTILGVFSVGSKEMGSVGADKESENGSDMYNLIKKLFPICRSITGSGVRETLDIIGGLVPLEIREIATGTKVFDWTVPYEWNIKDAYIKNSKGERIVDFKQSNLHVVSYSMAVNKKMTLSELKFHLHTLPDQPDWIPYLTSYYNEDWGFCLTHNQYQTLKDDTYEVVIDSTLTDGCLNYGELYIEGKSKDEVLLSCYVCHPSMANDSLSGVTLLVSLAKDLINKKQDLKYSYRFLFIPETIGSIVWLSQNENKTSNIKHGLIATCLGDSGDFTYKKSRQGKAEIDQIVQNVLEQSGYKFKVNDFFPSGSDECQFCSPGFNLPVGSLTRSVYNEFDRYHTSADNLDFVSPEALGQSFKLYQKIINTLENNKTYLNLNQKCEPQLGRRGLYRSLGGQKGKIDIFAILWVLNMSDGKNSIMDISIRSGISFVDLVKTASTLVAHNLLKEINKE